MKSLSYVMELILDEVNMKSTNMKLNKHISVYERQDEHCNLRTQGISKITLNHTQVRIVEVSLTEELCLFTTSLISFDTSNVVN